MRIRTGLLMVVAVLLAGITAAFAQTETGRITGTVKDQQNSVVPGATVTATAVGAGTSRTTVSDSTGNYVLANLQPLAYELKFSLQGFKVVTMRVTVPVGQALNVDARLDVGGASETVTVQAPASDVVNTANAEVSTVVTQNQIKDLPNLER